MNGREGPSESCHMTPEPIWVTDLMETNAAALPARIQPNSSTPGLSVEYRSSLIFAVYRTTLNFFACLSSFTTNHAHVTCLLCKS